MTAERIAEIRARVDAATPGPWDYEEGEWECDHSPGDDDEYPVHSGKCDKGEWISPPGVSKAFTEDCGDYCALSLENAEFVANARQDVPDLLDALVEANARIAKLQAVVDAAIQMNLHTRVSLAGRYDDCRVPWRYVDALVAAVDLVPPGEGEQ